MADEEVDLAEQEAKTPGIYDQLVGKLIAASWQNLDARLDLIRNLGIDVESLVIFAHVDENAQTNIHGDMPVKLATNPNLDPRTILRAIDSVRKSLLISIENEDKEKANDQPENS